MATKKNKTIRWIIGAIIIIGAIVALSTLKLGDNLVYFYTPAEAYAKADQLGNQTIRIGALVQKGSVVWQPENLSLSFLMTDLQGHDIHVEHKGTPPDLFKDGQGVVVEGRLTDGGHRFIAQKLMVKHSEEYRPPSQHAQMNSMLLEKSLFKGDRAMPQEGAK